jgi:hypothetical protein
MRGVFLLTILAGCTAGDRAQFGCPPEEVCSDDTPFGLHFVGHRLAGGGLGTNTAIGGTHDIQLLVDTGEMLEPLVAPYDTDDEGGPAVRVVGTDAEVVTLRGIAAGSNKLNIRDPDDGSLYDRKTFGAAEVSRIDIVPERFEVTDRPLGFLPGNPRVGIALHGVDPETSSSVIRLVDQDMTIALAGVRVAWDVVELAEATVGTHPIEVTAGTHPTITLEVPIVPQVDVLVDHPLVIPPRVGRSSFLCFEALAGERHVAGLAWSFTVDQGEIEVELGANNCVFFTPERVGAMVVGASAGGREQTVALQVAPAARMSPAPTKPGPSLGERARLVLDGGAATSYVVPGPGGDPRTSADR